MCTERERECWARIWRHNVPAFSELVALGFHKAYRAETDLAEAAELGPPARRSVPGHLKRGAKSEQSPRRDYDIPRYNAMLSFKTVPQNRKNHGSLTSHKYMYIHCTVMNRQHHFLIVCCITINANIHLNFNLMHRSEKMS